MSKWKVLIGKVFCFKGIFRIYVLIRLRKNKIKSMYLDGKLITIPGTSWSVFGRFVVSKRD